MQKDFKKTLLEFASQKNPLFEKISQELTEQTIEKAKKGNIRFSIKLEFSRDEIIDFNKKHSQQDNPDSFHDSYVSQAIFIWQALHNFKTGFKSRNELLEKQKMFYIVDIVLLS